MNYKNINLPGNLAIRPARPSDRVFLEHLHQSTREDLQAIEADAEFIQSIIDMQYRAQTQGYQSQFPNAMSFIIEYQQQSVGRSVLDFGPNEIRVVDIALIPAARGQGFGEAVIRAFMLAAQQVMTPLTLSVTEQNLVARQLYSRMGFQVEEIARPYIRMIWYPSSSVDVMSMSV
ncbi:GNAT family N-acetyltransferase [Gynuella sunshinyii]|uniref:Acetyltransferase n=1 Tax=Gynuella sunshinyii YC6258 TaxID=1445510 RepID=A0A0C5V1D6_9GAMM|nr:GNAT family N-acetyltransferase [Gynuella sunshinyii]AJQ93335.1 acetyltransferase [Gynuella sunshinyii YC6258]